MRRRISKKNTSPSGNNSRDLTDGNMRAEKEHLLDSKYNVEFIGEPSYDDIISSFNLILENLSLDEKEEAMSVFNLLERENA